MRIKENCDTVVVVPSSHGMDLLKTCIADTNMHVQRKLKLILYYREGSRSGDIQKKNLHIIAYVPNLSVIEQCFSLTAN